MADGFLQKMLGFVTSKGLEEPPPFEDEQQTAIRLGAKQSIDDQQRRQFYRQGERSRRAAVLKEETDGPPLVQAMQLRASKAARQERAGLAPPEPTLIFLDPQDRGNVAIDAPIEDPEASQEPFRVLEALQSNLKFGKFGENPKDAETQALLEAAGVIRRQAGVEPNFEGLSKALYSPGGSPALRARILEEAGKINPGFVEQLINLRR